MVSRSWDDEAGLRNRDVQERFYTYIVDKLDAVLEKERLEGVTRETRSVDALDPVLSQLNSFAVQVYEKSVAVCLEAGNFAELIKSLNRLVTVLYPGAAATNETNATCVESAFLRRAKMTSLLLLYMICYIPTHKKVNDAVNLGGKLAMESRQVMTLFSGLPAAIQRDAVVQNALCMQRALLADLDFWLFRKSWDAVGELGRLICVKRAMEVLTKAYFTFPRNTLTRYVVFGLNDAEADSEMTRILQLKFGSEYTQRVVNGVVHLRVPKKRT
ncbi:hypothetical protein HDU98_001956 [Podochytrium sp. JEL0797]|nr:hypothetical protein HDU98_001956 [Podochytrium sp. JEL0797]